MQCCALEWGKCFPHPAVGYQGFDDGDLALGYCNALSDWAVRRLSGLYYCCVGLPYLLLVLHAGLRVEADQVLQPSNVEFPHTCC